MILISDFSDDSMPSRFNALFDLCRYEIKTDTGRVWYSLGHGVNWLSVLRKNDSDVSILSIFVTLIMSLKRDERGEKMKDPLSLCNHIT